MAKTDLLGYLSEFRVLLSCSSDEPPEVKEAIATIEAHAAAHDVVVYRKLGCRYCAAAEGLLLRLHNSAQPFDLQLQLGTDARVRRALEILLGVSGVTFPVVVVRGVFVGGSDDLAELHSAAQLVPMLTAAPVPFLRGEVHRSPAQERLLKPQLLTAPGGGTWWQPQLRCWANQTRLVSAVHVALFSLVLLLLALDEKLVALILLWVFSLDATIYVLHGAAPFSYLGTLTTLLCWRSRGAAVTSIPYKFVWGLYLFAVAPLILGCGGGEDSGGAGFGVCTELDVSSAQRATIVTFVGNSALLAALRF